MILSKSSVGLTEEFEDQLYPDSDGKPMGETDYHIASLVYLREAMQTFFRDVEIYVATNMFFYYEEGNPKVQWDFVRGWPSKYDPADLNAKGNDIAIETLEITHEGLVRG